ncbi:MAG: Lrp/AsnC family transcriptional regulator [Firmicutes bacterium]|nr:Lrp/AsnC family transcriptional regulator [Bacillota bacterium]
MLSPREKEMIRVLQEGVPLVNRPYRVLAEKLRMSEEELLDVVKDFIRRGIIRRFGALVRHQDLGYGANALVVWQVPEERIEEVGLLMAAFDEVSHCYQRPPRLPDWPYNLFTMIHGRSPDDCREIAARLARASGIEDYLLLFSTAELKKSCMNYFLEE